MIKTSRLLQAALPALPSPKPVPAQVYKLPQSKTYHIQGVDLYDAANKAVRASLGNMQPKGNTIREGMDAILSWRGLRTTEVKSGVVIEVTPDMQRAVWSIYQKYDRSR